MAEGNQSVKNLSYLLSSFIKGAVAPDPGAAEERPGQISASQAITKVFLQNDNLALEIRWHSD